MEIDFDSVREKLLSTVENTQNLEERSIAYSALSMLLSVFTAEPSNRELATENLQKRLVTLGILALEIKEGDEVIIPSFSFIASVNSILFCNAIPKFCDVDEKTFNIDAGKIEKLMRLSEVKLDDYVGVIIPCMGGEDGVASPRMVTTVKGVLAKGKPIAASYGAIVVLAKAGVLKGRKFAHMIDPSDPYFKDYFDMTDFEGATYSGPGVVQDGKIITD
jgi:putative intracellular protease/amidase